MKTLLWLVLMVACLLVPSAFAGSEGWSTYRGAWFDVQYPSEFVVRPSIKSTTATSGYDSAFFTSPAGDIELYIFSPQWNGEPADILCDWKKERVVSSDRKKRNGEIELRKTLVAKDSSYQRSYVDIVNETNNTRVVFGIKYRTAAAYHRFKPKYLKFKGSLQQFSD